MLTPGIAVIDFETTGLSADWNRIIEVGAVIVRDGTVVDSFVELMHPGCRLPWEITELTGITDAMLKGKPPPEKVMPAFREFLGDRVCVAHNAGFDSRFFFAEMKRARLEHDRPFLCTMMLARRLVDDALDHKLGTLAGHLKLNKPANLRAHRALDDVLMTVALWNRLTALIAEQTGGRQPDFNVYHTLMKRPKAAAAKYLRELAALRQAVPADEGQPGQPPPDDGSRTNRRPRRRTGRRRSEADGHV
ncbi:MAG: hypothetical protein A3K19_27010 [Lentisphaerae bacterium RIFOXYB12_FULL_65_16]|nr:MAG: hypothetical protein A3K18_28195 [Lentisphaerae bacterium RIFOXYA12_64_32]OGV88053.1 MAG: hypothetical protein A3K19_27010 [Lentisphaerae bacterium RIFOXYB12_FULL_65_16]